MVVIPYYNEITCIEMLSSEARMNVVWSWRPIYLIDITLYIINIVYTDFN
jgi:hypothetical protein